MSFDLNPALAAELQSRQVRIRSPDDDTLILLHVPINPGYFNKPRTNLLLKRARHGESFLVCVDEDLSYCGGDQSLMRAFKSGPRQNGWRILSMSPAGWRDSESALEAGLTALGFRGAEPQPDTLRRLTRQAGPRLLPRFGVDLTGQARGNRGEPAIGRAAEIERLAACVLCWGQARLGLIAGESGVGKTNLLHGLALFLAAQRPDIVLLRVDLVEVLAGTFLEAERETIMLELLREAHALPRTVLALERLDCALTKEGVAGLISQALDDDGLGLVATTLPGALRRFRRPPLGRRVQLVNLEEATGRSTIPILAALKNRIAAHHGVRVEDGLLPVAVRLAQDLPGRLPAKAIALLDQAASSAALLKASVVSPDDLFSAARHLCPEVDAREGARREDEQ